MNEIKKIIYINMERRDDRRQFMEKQLRGLGIDYERFSAVEPSIGGLVSPDGNHHEFFRRAIPRFKSYAENPKLYKRAIGVFGAYISHRRIHQRMAAEQLGNYIILEDDCRVTPESLSKVLSKLDDGSIPSDWDIVRSCWESTGLVEKFQGSSHESCYASEAKAHGIFGGAHFSLFRKESTQRILKYLDDDFVLAIDAAYSTHRLNVYHSNFGISIAPMGTDIPKLSIDPFHIRVRRKAKQIAQRFL